MIRLALVAIFPLLVFFGYETEQPAPEVANAAGSATGTLEKMIVSTGGVSMGLDLNRLNGVRSKAARQTMLRFDSQKNAFFTAIAFNDELRGVLPSAMPLVPQTTMSLPSRLGKSYRQLVLEELPWGGQYELVVRDAKDGFVFFNIQGQQFDFDPNGKVLSIREAGLSISKEFAATLGRPQDAGVIVGSLDMSANMQAIELTQMVDGEARADELPPMNSPDAGSVPGPDVVVGDLSGLAQFGSSSGTQVGLAVGTDSCNFGQQNLHWFQTPDNDHPVIPQNLYRMSGGASNSDRFEQIGQSAVKHAFTALTNNICNLGCNGVGGSNLGSGCSDPYSASLNSGPSLGSRAWINPFTGAYPRADSATPPNSHTGHAHTGVSHRIVTEVADLNTNLNPGAKYYAESQYVTPHEYTWCQANPGQCNMYNNVSHRQYNVTGTTCNSGTSNCYTFSTGGSVTVREKPAITEWTGSNSVGIEPAPGVDGIGTVAWKVTNPSAGVWHYEYAVFNQNLDRAISSFAVPVGPGVTISNVGFHMPPQHPGWSGDGTVGNTGFSSTPWTVTQGGGFLTWASETFAANPNANAVRWGTLYNFRFDANQPPITSANRSVSLGYFKTATSASLGVGPEFPAASLVSVSGRVLSFDGDGLRNALVVMRDATNHTRTAITSTFGYYTFENVEAGDYNISVAMKRYNFQNRSVNASDNLTGIDLQALNIGN